MSTRRRSNRWVMWIIIIVMVVGLAGLGLNSTLSNSQGTTVLKVGESTVSADEYYSALSTRLDTISQSQGTALTMEQARLTGVVDQVQSELINRATMSEIARRNNIRATDEAVSRELLEIQAFQDSAGKFNRNNFELYLKSRNLTENEYLEIIRENLHRKMVIDVLDAQHLKLPAFSDAIATMIGEERSLNLVTIQSEELADDIVVNDEEVRARYDANPEGYMADPVRHYQIAYLLPDMDAVTNEEIQQYYDENPDQFGQVAQISYEVLSFPNEDAAQAFYDDADFAALAEERGLSAEDYSYQDQPLSSLPEEAQELLKSGEAKIYPPVQSLLGWNVYKVDRFQEETVAPLSEVTPQIRKIIADEKLNQIISPEYETITNDIETGASPEEIANSSSLTFVDWSSDQDEIAGLTDQADFIAEAQNAPIGEERELIKLENGGLFVLQTSAEDEAKPAQFEDVKAEIETEIQREKLNEALDLRAETIKSEAEADSLENVASIHALEVENIDAVTSQSSFEAVPFPVASELFQNDVNEIWISGDDTNRYIVEITEINKFDASNEDGQNLLSNVEAQIEGSTSEGLIIDYLNAAAQEYGAVKYPAAIRNVEGQVR